MELNEFEKAQIAYDNMQFKEYDIDKVLDNFRKIINDNKGEIEKICEIDKIKSNDIREEMLEINGKVKKEIEQRKNLDDNFIISKYRDSIGVIGVIFDGSILVTIEMLKKLLLTKNAIVFCTNDKKYAITNLLVLYFRQALKLGGYDEECVQVINSKNYDEMYKHNNILRKIMVIGNKELQIEVASKAKIDVVKSGYNCFDMYIENVMDAELIKEILKVSDIELNIYVNSTISEENIADLGIDDYTEVESIDECIRDININSAGYSSSIFTNNGENANKFLKLVKSKNVFVNASPTVERALDIKDKDLLFVKQIMYKNG